MCSSDLLDPDAQEASWWGPTDTQQRQVLRASSFLFSDGGALALLGHEVPAWEKSLQLLHPALLDGAMQLLVETAARKAGGKDTYLPFAVRKAVVAAKMPEGELYTSVTVTESTETSLTADVEIFSAADADGSGEIDSSELRKALSKSSLSAAAVDMFKALDKDGSKRIGFDEYLKAYYKFASPAEIKELMLWVYPPKEEEAVPEKKLSASQLAEIKSIFVLYDANCNGLLEKKELFEALTASGYDDDEIEEMFEEYEIGRAHV